MGTSVAFCPLRYRFPPTRSISSITPPLVAIPLPVDFRSGWIRELKVAVTGMPFVLLLTLVHRTLLKSVIYKPPY